MRAIGKSGCFCCCGIHDAIPLDDRNTGRALAEMLERDVVDRSLGVSFDDIASLNEASSWLGSCHPSLGKSRS